MDNQKLWNDFCFQVEKLRTCNEATFQYVAEILFEKFGWSQSDGEIISQKAIQVGSGRFVKPDIIIQSESKKHFVIELKKPKDMFSDRNKTQLISYMRLLRLHFGILIGNSLQLFYEVDDDDNDPILIIDIPFAKDSKEGIEFTSIIHSNNYSFVRFKEYCESILVKQVEKEKIQSEINMLCSALGKDAIIGLVRKELLKTYSQNSVDEILGAIVINVTKKNMQPVLQQPTPHSIVAGGNRGGHSGEKQKITPENLATVYEMARPYLDGSRHFDKTVDLIVKETGMNINSVKMFLTNLRCMLEGKCYKNATSLAGYHIFVGGLVKDYPDKFDKIISSVQQHFNYYEKFGGMQGSKRQYIEQLIAERK